MIPKNHKRQRFYRSRASVGAAGKDRLLRMVAVGVEKGAGAHAITNGHSHRDGISRKQNAPLRAS